eukprot:763371-Hanusia_phi.AAC.3
MQRPPDDIDRTTVDSDPSVLTVTDTSGGRCICKQTQGSCRYIHGVPGRVQTPGHLSSRLAKVPR